MPTALPLPSSAPRVAIAAPGSHDSPGSPFAFPLERRAHRREPRAGSAMAAFYDAAGDLTLVPVTLVDRSRTGLGVLSPVPIAPGSRFTLYGADLPIPHMQGTVIHGAPGGRAHRLGLRCDARLAA